MLDFKIYLLHPKILLVLKKSVFSVREESIFLLSSAATAEQSKTSKVSGSQLHQAACCLSRHWKLGGCKEEYSIVLGSTVILWVSAVLRPAVQHFRNQKKTTSRADSMTRVIRTSISDAVLFGSLHS